MSHHLVLVVVEGGGAPRQARESCIREAAVMPAAVVSEGEHAGAAGGVPPGGVDNWAGRR